MNTADTASSFRCEDREFFERELASFVPERVFDAHCHLWHSDHAEFDIPGAPRSAGYPEFRSFAGDMYPGREVAGLFISWPVEESELAGEWIAKQVAAVPNGRGEFCIKPNDDPEWVRQTVRRLGLHGLKCYHWFASEQPAWEADIPDYLPERLVKVADEEGWIITLHMVKSRAVADPSNIHWIRHYCNSYPNMKLILAHSARGFQPSHNLEGLPKLAGLDNLYFDTSVNCEPTAHQTIIRIFSHKKLMYGTDFPVSLHRGRSLGTVDSFMFLYADTPVWDRKYTQIKPVLMSLEHLRSLKWACWSEKLSDSAVEDIFWNNAAKLFGLE